MKALSVQAQKEIRGGFFWFVFIGLAGIEVRAVGAAVASGLRK